MKQKLLRAENLLLLWLLIMPILSLCLVGISHMDNTQHYKYDLKPILYGLWQFITIWTVIAYFFHTLARTRNVRMPTAGKVHILISIYISGAVIYDFYAHIPLKAIQSKDVYNHYELYFTVAHNPQLFMFVLFQLLFILITSFRLIRQRKSSRLQ